MAKYHGKEGVIRIGAQAVGEVTGWDYEESVELADATAAGATAKSYMAGIPDGSGTMTFRHSPAPTADAGQALLDAGASVALELYPAGNVATRVKYTGTAIVKNVKRSADTSKVGEFSAQFQGVLTEGTV
ncbi:hypothetical protein FJ251_08825 [bacterium]|nr:hypothetical protein [bacterium]